jgi:hypothetical protein
MVLFPLVLDVSAAWPAGGGTFSGTWLAATTGTSPFRDVPLTDL